MAYVLTRAKRTKNDFTLMQNVHAQFTLVVVAIMPMIRISELHFFHILTNWVKNFKKKKKRKRRATV